MQLERLIPKAFRQPTALELATSELEEARRSLLSAQTAQEYARRMSEYHADRIARLTRYVKTVGTEKASQE